MSCESPFSYEEFSVEVSSSQTVGTSGSYTLPSYTIPSQELCMFVPGHCDWHWGGWLNTVRECSWQGPSWCCCWGTPAITIWPSIDFTASASFDLEFVAGSSIAITVEGPNTPIETTSITINSGTLTLTVDTTPITINLVPNPITINQENGSFSIDIELESFSTTYSAGGFDYTFTLDSDLQFCLDPVPPVGWINLQLSCGLSTGYDGVNYGTNFTIECPIVSVED